MRSPTLLLEDFSQKVQRDVASVNEIKYCLKLTKQVLLKPQPVWLGASLHQPDGILSKLSHWLHCLGDLIHCNLILCVICIKM